MGADGGTMELVTTLPVAVVGPVIGEDVSESNHLIQRIMSGRMPGFPNIYIPIASHLGSAAGRVPKRSIPDVVVRVAALFSPEFRGVRDDLGYCKQLSDAKARRVLGWQPRDPSEAIVAAAQSMISKGLVRAVTPAQRPALTQRVRANAAMAARAAATRPSTASGTIPTQYAGTGSSR